jgi:hypothetical protein
MIASVPRKGLKRERGEGGLPPEALDRCLSAAKSSCRTQDRQPRIARTVVSGWQPPTNQLCQRSARKDTMRFSQIGPAAASRVVMRTNPNL